MCFIHSAPRFIVLLLLAFLLCSCRQDSSEPTASAATGIDSTDDTPPVFEGSVPAHTLPEVTSDRRVPQNNSKLLNAEAPIPPQCYTKTEGRHNPCYTCHQLYDRKNGEDRLNQLDDGSLQGGYMFSDIGVTNHWSNLFVDRSEWLTRISDDNILHYINTENYSSLAPRLINAGWKGFIPDLNNYARAAEAFDEQGLANDGSFWVAFNYKPFPGTFWPTNGSTDDVVIRLPNAFREVSGEFSVDAYFVNLTLIELNIKNLAESRLWPVDENLLGADIDGNGVLEVTDRVVKSSQYIGDASGIALEYQQFPIGTEFMHSVRYVGVTGQNEIVVSPRMKELRYMNKVNTLPRATIGGRYAKERKEKLLGELPVFINRYDAGFDNGLGWFVQGFIEDYEGELRAQSFEEGMFCMGCHAAIGTTIDSTFSFARKITGVEGWGYINLKSMVDAPSLAEPGGEILNYLRRSGGGSEFRGNPEMLARWYRIDGSVDTEKVTAADVYELITPSRRRALDLNKAYTHIVRHQSYIYGRDASWVPAQNIFRDIDEEIPPLESQHRFYNWDIRLDWRHSLH